MAESTLEPSDFPKHFFAMVAGMNAFMEPLLRVTPSDLKCGVPSMLTVSDGSEDPPVEPPPEEPPDEPISAASSLWVYSLPSVPRKLPFGSRV